MIEKLKKLPFIEESEAVRIDLDYHIFERYDRTIRIVEKIPDKISLNGEGELYITAAEILPLLENIKSITKQGTTAEIKLNNGAKYLLAGRDTKFEEDNDDSETQDTFTITLPNQLLITTLKNLLDPVLQTVYIDNTGAVSTNSLNACIDSSVKSPKEILLPPDILQLITGQEAKVSFTETALVIRFPKAIIKTPLLKVPQEHNFLLVRGMAENEPKEYISTKGLDESLKRLSSFGEFVSFTEDKAQVGENYEPFEGLVIDEEGLEYPIVDLLAMLPMTQSMGISQGNLFLKGKSHLFVVSPKETE